jgi:hypothetical protein
LREWRIGWLVVEVFRRRRGIPRFFAERVIVMLGQHSALGSAGSTGPTTTLSLLSSGPSGGYNRFVMTLDLVMLSSRGTTVPRTAVMC